MSHPTLPSCTPEPTEGVDQSQNTIIRWLEERGLVARASG
jgi:hypothetical protein